MKYVILLVFVSLLSGIEYGEAQVASEEEVIFYTQEWEGNRDEYGRPLVSDGILERMEQVALEEAWGTLREAGHHNRFEGDWHIMYPEQVMVGRAVTARFLPSSPELEARMDSSGREGGLRGSMNQWPIYMLEQGDVYVADGFGKIRDGTLIGDNLGQGIYANSGNGPVLYGSARDLGGLRNLEGFNAWVKGWHPTAIQEMMLVAINDPTRIGEAVVLPGDVVLAAEEGVLFIPAHLAERVVVSSEITRLVDTFRIERMGEGVYELEDVYGSEWTDEINQDFYGWLEANRERLHTEQGTGYETIDEMVSTRSRNWREWMD